MDIDKTQIINVAGRHFTLAKVIMLDSNHEPTLKGGELWVNYDSKLKLSRPNSICPIQSFKHLYIYIKCKIKEGDWCYDSEFNIIFQKNKFAYKFNDKYQFKIIATTDDILTVTTVNIWNNGEKSALPQSA